MEHYLHKRLSIGISFGLLSVDEMVSILERYKDYIHDIYFSPSDSVCFQSRKKIYAQEDNEIIRAEKLDFVLRFAARTGIPLNIVLNTPMVSPTEQLKTYLKYRDLYPIQYVTTFSETAKLIHTYNRKQSIMCSYNEGINSFNQLKDICNNVSETGFGTIILGSHFLRNFEAFKLIREHGLFVKLLVNNGCTFYCNNYCRDSKLCNSTFKSNVKKFDINYLYALQSLFPEELYKYYLSEDSIDVVKLSTRPISFKEYCRLLDSYIDNNSTKYLEDSPRNYHLYARLAHFAPFYETLNLEKILNYKKQIVSKALKIQNQK